MERKTRGENRIIAMIGYIAGALAAGAATFAGVHTMVPWSQLYGENFNGIQEGPKILALTYDDGPNDPWTMKLLEVLDRQQVQATFFMLGKYVRQRPEIARAVPKPDTPSGITASRHPNLILRAIASCGRSWKRLRRPLRKPQGSVHFCFVRPLEGAGRGRSKWSKS